LGSVWGNVGGGNIVLHRPSRVFIDVAVDSRLPVVAAVNAVQFCPYNSSLFASGGLDGVLRIWNVTRNPNKPMYSRKPMIGYIQDLQWDPYGNGIFCSSADSTLVRF
jgi:WD40 repeat protein